uniref:Testis expressed 264, ER-phagy receptor n=2 Tax=Takifugu rubripes TaxID=31033 RepID=A0A674N5G3_TAKRU
MSDWLIPCVVISSVFTAITVVAHLLYSNFVSGINVLTGCPPIKKFTFAYIVKEGSYRTTGQLFKESHSIGPKLPQVAVFYDDPKKGPRCRYAVGRILSEGEDKADEELLKRCGDSGFNVFSFPEATHVVTTSLPHRTVFSVPVGVGRVYPKLQHYIKEKRLCAHPFLEIYRDGQIHFMAPLARQGDFYVPEVRRVERRPPVKDGLQSDSEISDGDWSSESSSGTEELSSGSGESSVWESRSRSASVRHEKNRGRSSGEITFKDLNCEQTGGRQTEREERLHRKSNPKSSESPAVAWRDVVEEEEAEYGLTVFLCTSWTTSVFLLLSLLQPRHRRPPDDPPAWNICPVLFKSFIFSQTRSH